MAPRTSTDTDSTPSSQLTKRNEKATTAKTKVHMKTSTPAVKRKVDEEHTSESEENKPSEPKKAKKAEKSKNPKTLLEKIKADVNLLESRGPEQVNVLKKRGEILGKKKWSSALENPYMGRTYLETHIAVPAPIMRPKRGLLGTDAVENGDEYSPAKEPELDRLLTLGNTKVFTSEGRLLHQTARFSFKWPLQVEPYVLKKAAECTSNGLDPARPPISTIDGIFDDMATNAIDLGLEAALPSSGLRLATMCSGTEAPLLGMGLLKQALMRQDKTGLDVRHIFSAEIEPYKQAYIERNFSPPVLFRDVTDFCTAADARTAYGGTAKQPQDVHILVAGSSCVDYSSLNRTRKAFGDEGQSYRTLEGIRKYVERARPNILILENVRGAPWNLIKAFFEKIDYACNHVLVDTKNYYLPQTRERGYLIALDTKYLTEDFQIETALAEWSKLMWQFQRRANAPFSDFIYDDDDPELHATKLDFASMDVSTSTMRWDACRHRYAKLRIEKRYGSKRPMTHWQDNGSCKFPDFGWIKWGKSQRERIWDTLDIEYLRHAGERDYDINYKIRWLELSQNVDRDLDSRRWGIISCLTPTGIPYLTTRGGPVSGGESLLLQGIPKYALNLTKETSRQLQNLAGNAMSVPVVTAAILSGILAVNHGMKEKGDGRSYFKDFLPQDGLKAGPTDSTIETTPIASSLKKLLDGLGAGTGKLVPVCSMGNPDADQILDFASRSLQFCKCEGTLIKKEGSFQICDDCGHTTCKICGQNPVHNYRDIPEAVTESRGSPADFMTMITEALPTILQFDITDGEEPASEIDPMEKHQSCKQEFKQAAQLAFRSTVHFKHVKRGHAWKITFEGSHSRLELRLTRKCQPSAESENDFFGRQAVECYWLLFATILTTGTAAPVHDAEIGASDAGGTLREALQHPIARMIPQSTLLDGKWEIMRYSRVNLDIKMAGQGLLPAWERSIGLLSDEFRALDRADALEIQVITNDQTSEVEGAVGELGGIYELRPHCGTANTSLHVRCETADEAQPLMFFFLDPEQLKNEVYDSFVFSKNVHRRGYKEHRMIEAEVDAGWRPYHLATTSSDGSGPEDSALSKEPQKPAAKPAAKPAWTLLSKPKAKASSRKPRKPTNSSKPTNPKPKPNGPFRRGTSSTTTVKNWLGCDALVMHAPDGLGIQRFWTPPKFDLKIPGQMSCSQPSTFMLIELPIETYKGSDWKPGYKFSIDVAGNAASLDKFRWLIERAAGQVVAENTGYQYVPVELVPRVSCSTCAPKSSSIVYQNVKIAPKKKTAARLEEDSLKPADEISGNHEKDVVKVMEVMTEATAYEEALKKRPTPILALVHCHEKSAILEIKLNIPALCHRALAKLCSSDDLHLQETTIRWLLAEDHGRDRAPKFQVTHFLNNELETESAKPKSFMRELWPEQRQALTWMVRQEIHPCAWQEQEREEVSIPVLGCRVDVETRMQKKVRGGVLADEVGGGKTTTSLALIAEMLELQKNEPMPKDSRSISLDATLILVPAGILTQWKEEINKCFTDVRYTVVKNMADLIGLKVAKLRKQDIILASWSIFDGPGYWNALEQLCDASNLPLKPGRALQVWLRKAMDDLGLDIEESGGTDTHKVWQEPRRRKQGYEAVEALNKHDPKTRSSFVALFHAFTFRRIIIDEYSYLKGSSFLAALELKASAMWLLSGTPPVSNFDAVNTTAKFLKTKLTSEDEKDGCFSFVTAGPQLGADWTDAERFQWYNDNRSTAWLKARNGQVDDFIKKFVRKNSSEAAKDIQRLSHYELSPLSATEQLVYFEVSQRLMSQSIKFKTKQPKKGSMDSMKRSKRIDMTVNVSENLEDALLSCCSEASIIYYDIKPNTTKGEMHEPDIRQAKRAIVVLLQDIYTNLKECFAYEQARNLLDWDVLENATANPHFLSFKLRIKNNDVGDKFVAEMIDRVMLIAYNNQELPTAPYMLRADRGVEEVSSLNENSDDSDDDDDHKEDEDEGDEENEENENDEEADEIDDDLVKPLTAAEKFAVVENEATTSTIKATGKPVAAKGRGKNLKQYTQVYKDNFALSMRPRPPYMDEIFKKAAVLDAAAKIRKQVQQKFRRSDFGVRNDQEKSRSEDMNMVTIDIVKRVRDLRLAWNLQLVARNEPLPACSGCRQTQTGLTDLFILGICGHIACDQCLRDVEGRKNNPDGCLDKYCSASCLQHHLIEASLFSPQHTSTKTTYGSKMDDVTNKIASILGKTPSSKSRTDSILLFVQFPRVLNALTRALDGENVLYLNAAAGTDSARDETVEKFRKGQNENKKDAKVLILLVDSVNAAGWNLQRANHVMFVSAYFAPTQAKYEATMTQAIGRAHRFGQKKTVHVYHFLMAKTLEVNIIQGREGKALERGEDGEFVLVERVGGEPTAWEGPDMQGAASGVGAVEL